MKTKYRWIAQDDDGQICHVRGEEPWRLGSMNCWANNEHWTTIAIHTTAPAAARLINISKIEGSIYSAPLTHSASTTGINSMNPQTTPVSISRMLVPFISVKMFNECYLAPHHSVL